MGQAKRRGTFEERKAEAIRLEKPSCSKSDKAYLKDVFKDPVTMGLMAMSVYQQVLRRRR